MLEDNITLEVITLPNSTINIAAGAIQLDRSTVASGLAFYSSDH